MQISMKLWEEGDDPPEEPQLQVVDTNGLNHNRQTRDDATNVEVLFGASFGQVQQPGATSRIDDLTITLPLKLGQGIEVQDMNLPVVVESIYELRDRQAGREQSIIPARA